MQATDLSIKDKTRRFFNLFFLLSSLLPLLFVTYLITQNVLPFSPETESGYLLSTILFIVLLPVLSYFWMTRWIHLLEDVTSDIQSKSREFIEDERDYSDLPRTGTVDVGLALQRKEYEQEKGENEIQILIRSFNAIFQTAENQFEEKRRFKELLSKLIVIASDLTAELDFDRLFPLIIAGITDFMSAERTSLYIIDRNNHEIWTRVAEGISQIRLPIGKGISGRVAETGMTVNVVDAWDVPYFDRTFDMNNNFRTRSVLCMPIRNRSGESIGVVEVINKRGKDYFSAEDEIFLRGLSSQISIALENSFLVDELWLSFESFIRTLSAAVDARDPLTAGHSQRVTEYSLMIAAQMGLGKSEMDGLKYAALLHDIGKIGIHDSILSKHGIYTTEEREEMGKHPLLTKTILDNFLFPKALQDVPKIACHHHEKVDGQGYPDGLKGDQIPLGSKIIAIADVFDALTSRREYPKYRDNEVMGYDPLPLQMVVSMLQDKAGSHLDADVVEAFIRCLPQILEMHKDDHFPPEYAESTINLQ